MLNETVCRKLLFQVMESGSAKRCKTQQSNQGTIFDVVFKRLEMRYKKLLQAHKGPIEYLSLLFTLKPSP